MVAFCSLSMEIFGDKLYSNKTTKITYTVPEKREATKNLNYSKPKIGLGWCLAGKGSGETWMLLLSCRTYL